MKMQGVVILWYLPDTGFFNKLHFLCSKNLAMRVGKHRRRNIEYFQVISLHCVKPLAGKRRSGVRITTMDMKKAVIINEVGLEVAFLSQP